MRGLLLAAVLAAGLCAVPLAGCSSEPSIACTADEHCLSGQHCSAGWCASVSESTAAADASTMQGSDDAAASPADAAIDAPPTCSPTCSGNTPYCHAGTCVQCTSSLHCPLVAPRCVDYACVL